ncbi:hypothetical protein LshimejAT787_1000750 [Lyophyllum shimeji]|uniref:Uncharacterized protein n=1 Tax=Lyophyllum shimeji TaxID=47721 RepID=A0A9P3PRM8_LYOSH|nr:hypothetical protein LshimejAT787_1000750 [Lyophyllum shimeji]
MKGQLQLGHGALFGSKGRTKLIAIEIDATWFSWLKRIAATIEGKGSMQEWLGMLGSAGTAKCVASLITYPHEVIRTRLR